MHRPPSGRTPRPSATPPSATPPSATRPSDTRSSDKRPSDKRRSDPRPSSSRTVAARPVSLRSAPPYAHSDRTDLVKLLRMCELKCSDQPGEVHRLLTDLTHRVESSGDSVLQTKWLLLKSLTSLELGDAESASLHLRASMLTLNEFEALSDLRSELIAEIEELSHAQHQTWDSFRQSFEHSHPSFMLSLMSKCPALSPMEVKICSLLRADVPTKEVAELLSITKRAIENHRFHIRRKLGLGPKDNLTTYLMCM